MISFALTVRADDVREPYILHRCSAFCFLSISGFSFGLVSALCDQWVGFFDYLITCDHRINRSVAFPLFQMFCISTKKGPPKRTQFFAKDERCWLFVVVNARRDHAVRAGIDEDETAHAHGVGIHRCDFQVSAAHN